MSGDEMRNAVDGMEWGTAVNNRTYTGGLTLMIITYMEHHPPMMITYMEHHRPLNRIIRPLIADLIDGMVGDCLR